MQGKLFHKYVVWGKKEYIIILISTNNWTNKREVMYVSRLKWWYSVNKVSIGTIDNIYWGVISAKTFLSDLDTEITFGW